MASGFALQRAATVGELATAPPLRQQSTPAPFSDEPLAESADYSASGSTLCPGP